MLKKTFVVFSGIVIFSLLFSFVILAEDSSLPQTGMMPDSPLYFLKTAKEKIQTFFTFGAENKAKQFLHLADVRLAEYQKMVEKGKTEIAEKTLQKYQNQLDRALNKVQEVKDKGKDVQDVTEKVKQSTAKHLEVLQENLQKVPEKARKGLETAIENSSKNIEKVLGKKVIKESSPDINLELVTLGNLQINNEFIIRLIMTPILSMGKEFFDTPAIVDLNLPSTFNLVEGNSHQEVYFSNFDAKVIELKVISQKEGEFDVNVEVEKQNSGKFWKSINIKIGEIPKDETTAKITLLSPNGGEKWAIGKTYQIKWTASNVGNGYAVYLDLVKPTDTMAGGWFVKTVSKIGTADVLKGYYEWTIPKDISQADNYKIRVTNEGAEMGDVSDNYFTIISSDETADWKTYRNEKYGFEVKYPAILTVKEGITGAGDRFISFANPQFKVGQVGISQVNSIFILGGPEGDIPAGGEIVTIDGRSAKKIETETTQPNYWIKTDKALLLIMYSFPEGAGSNYNDYIDINSFKFIK